MPRFEAYQPTPPSSFPPASESSFVTCHASKLTNPFLPLPPLQLVCPRLYRAMFQTRTHQLEGRKREERVSELRSVAHHKQELTCWRGGRGRSRLVSLKTQMRTHQLEGRKR